MKKYSWISYVSLGLPILLFLLLFAVADIEPLVLAQIILFAQFIGAPLSIILSVARERFRRNLNDYPASFSTQSNYLTSHSETFTINREKSKRKGECVEYLSSWSKWTNREASG